MARNRSADEFVQSTAAGLGAVVDDSNVPTVASDRIAAQAAGSIVAPFQAECADPRDDTPESGDALASAEPNWAIDPSVMENGDESWFVSASAKVADSPISSSDWDEEFVDDQAPQATVAPANPKLAVNVSEADGNWDDSYAADGLPAMATVSSPVATSAAGQPAEIDWPGESMADGPATFVSAPLPVEDAAAADSASTEQESAESALAFDFAEPQALLGQLQELTFECSTGEWAMEVAGQVRKFELAAAQVSDTAPSILGSLDDLATQADALAASIDDVGLARQVRRAGHAISRHVALWWLALDACDVDEREELFERVERCEQNGLASDGQALAEAIARLAESPVPQQQAFARWLGEIYGNANLRVNVCQSLLNRFIPAPQPEYGEVHDTILGLPVHGNSLTSTGITVEFVPDADRLRMAFRVAGEVAALTSASAGPAHFVNGSESMYFARKDLEIRADGIVLSPAAVSVQSRMELRSVETDLDWIPVVGMIVQNVARSQHEASQPAASREVEEKISQQARTRVDEEVYAKLNTAVSKLRDRVFVPMNRLTLQPTMIAAETTDERMVARLRLAGAGQVGGFTPRPRDPADCVLSVQFHESAINNFLQRLELDGRTFTLPEVAKHVSEKLNLSEPWVTNPDHDDVSVTFAPQNAIVVRCQDGLLMISLSISRLSNSSAAWRDFQARVFYRPEVEGRSVRLVRDGVVQLISPRLGNRGQLAVRGVLSTLFPKDRAWNVTPDKFVHDERVQDLAVTQMLIEEGWFALALSPGRLAEQPAGERR